jgi:hypothetical protein
MTERPGLGIGTNVTPKRRRAWKERFLATFRQTGNVLVSCHAAGISRTQAYRERRNNVHFADDWTLAEEDATEMLEAEARRRAMASSDTLLIFLLKARRPSVYREYSRMELTGKDGPPVQPGPFDGLTDAERRTLMDIIDEALAAQGRGADASAPVADST